MPVDALTDSHHKFEKAENVTNAGAPVALDFFVIAVVETEPPPDIASECHDVSANTGVATHAATPIAANALFNLNPIIYSFPVMFFRFDLDKLIVPLL